MLDVDAAFLGFWGCTCPSGYYWGYASAQALATERSTVEGRGLSLGALEAVLEGRQCLPCPADLAVRCSPLAVEAPPHIVTASVYPLTTGGRPRALLPYLNPGTLLHCLHPAVCGGSPLFVDDWVAWAALASTGAAVTADFAEFQCREGHDADTPMCAGCLRGYWQDGFLCRRCFAGAAALVVLGALAGAALLAYAVRRSLRAGADAAHNYATIVTWFFQVAQTLQVSTQINAAQQSGRTDRADGGAGVSSYLPALSFRPWALECLVAGWSFAASSAALLALPWAVAAGMAVRPAWRRAGVLVLDLLYLPAAQRAIQWLNQRTLPLGDIGGDRVSELLCNPAHR